MRPTLSKFVTSSVLALAATLSACSSDDGEGEADAPDATDAKQTDSTSPPADEKTADTGAEADTQSATGTIGGEQTGLTMDLPDEWVEVPMDADSISEGLDSLDLPEDQAGFIESSIGALGDLDGAVMAIDASTLGADVATNVNAYCVPNDGSVGEDNLEAAIRLGLEAIAEDIEVGEASVDGVQAIRATYTLDVPALQGLGVQYMFLNDGNICWVTFTGAGEGHYDVFEQMAASIRVH